MKKLGLITIGQSPRTDVLPDIEPIFGPDVELHQAGALDGLTREEIAQMDDQPFAAQMRAEGIESIIKYEAAFSGRRVVIVMQ